MHRRQGRGRGDGSHAHLHDLPRCTKSRKHHGYLRSPWHLPKRRPNAQRGDVAAAQLTGCGVYSYQPVAEGTGHRSFAVSLGASGVKPGARLRTCEGDRLRFDLPRPPKPGIKRRHHYPSTERTDKESVRVLPPKYPAPPSHGIIPPPVCCSARLTVIPPCRVNHHRWLCQPTTGLQCHVGKTVCMSRNRPFMQDDTVWYIIMWCCHIRDDRHLPGL